MKQFIFRTNATMKPHNNKNWWISSDVVTEKRITAENVNAAVKEWAAQVEEKHYITVSPNAIKNKSPMYIDSSDGEAKQIGFVITGKTDFQRDNGQWSAQYIDLWVEILTVTDTEF